MTHIETLLLNCSHFHPDTTELEKLAKSFPQLRVTVAEETSYTIEQLARAQIVVGFPRPEDLPKAKNLSWLQTPSAGVGAYTNKTLYQNESILLTSAVGTYGKQIADHVLGMIIAFNHNFFLYHRQMETQHWERYFPTSDIWESTILLIGFGDIGKNIAIRAKAHGMQVIAVKRTMSEKTQYVDEVYTSESLDDLLPRADYVVLCVASTPQTENIFDARRIGYMKKGSYLINVARGALVDQEAMIQALENGNLAGAGLDVTEPEPLPPENALWRMPNVFITPHASGMSLSDSHQVFNIFFENLRQYFSGGTMRNLVEFDLGY